MIDDITIIAQWQRGDSSPEDWRLEGDGVQVSNPWSRRAGRRLDHETVTAPGLRFSFCRDEMSCALKLNPTRMASAGGPNFPLLDLQRFEDLDLTSAHQLILTSLSFDDEAIENGADFLRLGEWPVSGVAYPIDLQVGEQNLSPILRALQGLRRRYHSKVQTWSDRTGRVNSVQFGTAGRRTLMFYSKRDQLLSRVSPMRPPMGGRAPDVSEATLEQARGVLRCELTFKGVRQVRGAFGQGVIPTEYAPKFRLMADRRTANHLLCRELDRLGLLDLFDGVTPEAESRIDPAAVARDLFVAVRAFNEGSAPGGARRASRPHISWEHAAALGFTYLVRAAGVDVRDLVGWAGGHGESTFKRHLRDLRALGLPPLENFVHAPQEQLLTLMDRLRQTRPDLQTTSLPDFTGQDRNRYLRRAWWVEQGVDDAEEIQ
ncbi:MAG TPA: hypothetical protein VFS43_20665 [Polyangiaceae bacterium]|nr:hypothetical protein [Polyangiaceae bacterium]